jgi:undecaprenyl-diphosphatase
MTHREIQPHATATTAPRTSVRDAIRQLPWPGLALGWVIAFAAGAAVAFLIRGLGWWPGAPWERELLVAANRTVGPVLDVIMLTLPLIGTNYTLAPLVAVAAVILWRRGLPAAAVHLAVVQAGSWALNPSLKFTFPRDRPALFEARGQYAFPAYPSGHAIAVVAVLFTAAWLLHRYRGVTWGYWAVGGYFLLNSWSRIYLAVHWPTDVIAGAIVGGIWLLFTIRLLGKTHI